MAKHKPCVIWGMRRTRAGATEDGWVRTADSKHVTIVLPLDGTYNGGERQYVGHTMTPATARLLAKRIGEMLDGTR